MGLNWHTVRREGAEALRVATLDNGRGLQAQLMSYGATLLSLRVPDRHGEQLDVTLGFDAPEGYYGVHPYFGAVIGRYGNRISGARFMLDGQAFQLPANEGPNQLHGGLRGFDKVPWALFGEASGDSPHVGWRHVSAAGDQGYPGTVQAQVVYSLKDDALCIDYSATTDAPTVINLTQHSYFNLAGQGDVLGHELTVFGSRFLPVNEALVPTGELRAVEGTSMDFRHACRIGSRITHGDPQLEFAHAGFDHCWALDRPGLAARLFEPRSGRLMEVSTTQPGLQFYSGNQLDGSLHGKNGCAYGKYAGLCLETQHFPDSPNQPFFPSTVLRPGETYRHHTAFRFSIG